MRIRIRNLAAILVVCVVGFFSGTAADSGASRPKSGDLPQPAPAPVNPDGKGPVRALPERDAKPEGKVTLPSGTSQDWWSKVQENIRKDEYQVTWDANASFPGTKGAWQAPNRAQGFRTYFTENGVRLIPRVEGASPWEWGLQLVRWGRGDGTEPVAKAAPHITGNRVEFSRAHIAEWFVNDEQGLEQGFTISAPPSRGGAPPPPGSVSRQASPVPPREGAGALPYTLHIDLALTGNLHPKFAEDGQVVDFYAAGSISVLRYGQLKVTDASGRVLSSRFEGAPGAIRIAVDDTAALYPITVDPLATSPAWIVESNQADASFGASVGTAGDVNGDGYSDAIVGAHRYDNGQTDEGRAFVYPGGPSGLAMTPVWAAESDQANAYYGYSVGTAGDVNGDGYSDVIVGAYRFDNGQTDQGRAYVYLGSAAGLVTGPAWTAEADIAGAGFGISLGTAGDVNGDGYGDVIVGAYGYYNGQAGEGRAYVYLGSAAGLSTGEAWTAESDVEGAHFGMSVGTAGDVNGDGYSDIIVGAPFDQSSVYQGQAYVYLGSAAGLSTSFVWWAVCDWAGTRFGMSVGTAGDVNGDGYSDVIVGAYLQHGTLPPFNPDVGRAYVYLGMAGGVSHDEAWTAEGQQPGEAFGFSVGSAGDVNGDGYGDVIVGALGYDSGTNADAGRVSVYLGGTEGLSGTSAWAMAGDQQNAQMGNSVGTAGDVNGDGYSDIILGAYLYDNGQANEGRACVYLGGVDGLTSYPLWTAESDQADAAFGISVGTAGDVNGDGYSDLIIGAPWYDSGQPNAGGAYVYLGSVGGISESAAWITAGDQANAEYGGSVGTAGDVNGDGYGDVIVGAVYYDDGQPDEGRAYVYLGGVGGLATSSHWIAESDQAEAYFGASVATAGDVNGDGYGDVIIGASGYDSSEVDDGRALVYLGGVGGLSTGAAWTAESDQDAAYFGVSVGTAGDVNGDGYSDVLVGASYYDNGQIDEGRAYVFLGGSSGLSPGANWMAEGDQALVHFGGSVGTAGDVNGDGYSDVIVGATRYTNDQPNEGRAYVYLGQATGLSSSAAWVAEGDQDYPLFGVSVGTAGDVNADGYSDVIVGASYYDNGLTDEGRSFLYLGSAAGLSTGAVWTAESNQAGARFGWSVGTAGDVNGDGFSDIIIGAPWYDNGQVDEGRAFLYYGNNGPCISTRPQQLRNDLSGPIAPLGRAEGGLFRVACTGRTPFGRGDVKIEWQMAPLGYFHSGLPYWAASGWADSGTSGVSLDQQVLLAYEAPYVWRLRTKYRAATTPFQGHGPWLTLAANGLRETDLRRAPPCDPPDEPCWLYSVTKVDTDYTLNWQDPNQSDQRTGWNIRRSNDPAPPKSTWPLVGTNVVDMDQSVPNYQWTDHSGADPGPGGVWYYQVTTYNANCPAEGPF